MATLLATFGSIFKYKDAYFVFFAITPEGDRIFAARICDEEQTQGLQNMSRKYEKRTNSNLSGSLALCFIILKTIDFEGQAASFHGTGDNVTPEGGPSFTGKMLEESDVADLKKTILEDKAMPPLLVKLVQELSNDIPREIVK